MEGGVQKPGGGEAAGLLCSDQALCTVLPGLRSSWCLRGKMAPASCVTSNSPFQEVVLLYFLIGYLETAQRNIL